MNNSTLDVLLLSNIYTKKNNLKKMKKTRALHKENVYTTVLSLIKYSKNLNQEFLYE